MLNFNINRCVECNFLLWSYIDGKKFYFAEDDLKILAKECSNLDSLQLPANEVKFVECIGEGKLHAALLQYKSATRLMRFTFACVKKMRLHAVLVRVRANCV